MNPNQDLPPSVMEEIRRIVGPFDHDMLSVTLERFARLVQAEQPQATEEELRIAHIHASAGSSYPGYQETCGILARCILRLTAKP